MTTLTANPDSDAALVELSLRRDRSAFERIVSRYQTLVCSVALAAVGEVAQSEDIAQETFITAWRRLSDLRDPAALRGWLCGIARNLAANSLRRRRVTQPIDPATESMQPSPHEVAAGREEQAILSRSLERIPFLYRQPMILFYRQDQSVSEVAEVMSLSEETVRQRLSRGRKLLQAEVTSLLENALRQSAPKRAFTMGVIAALPVAASTAKAATISAAAMKGSAAAASSGAVAWMGALLGPAIGLLGGYLGVSAGYAAAKTDKQRRLIVRTSIWTGVWALAANIILFAFILFASSHSNWQRHPVVMAVLGIGLPLAFSGSLVILIMRSNRALKRALIEDCRRYPELYLADAIECRDYKSKATLLGIPLVHVRRSMKWSATPDSSPAIGWIAIGEKAYGVLFALGGFSVGAISLGGISVGLISIGGIGLGLLSICGVGIGVLCAGGAAFGWAAVGGLAVGWWGASGGMALARQFASGGLAMAAHANDAAARGAWDAHPWLDLTRWEPRTLLAALIWLPVFSVLLILRMTKKRKNR